MAEKLKMIFLITGGAILLGASVFLLFGIYRDSLNDKLLRESFVLNSCDSSSGNCADKSEKTADSSNSESEPGINETDSFSEKGEKNASPARTQDNIPKNSSNTANSNKPADKNTVPTNLEKEEENENKDDGEEEETEDNITIEVESED